MKINKIFHSLYFMVMFLPLFIIPIFAININQKSVEPISIEVQEQISVDFNQQVRNGNFVDNTIWSAEEGVTLSFDDNEMTINSTINRRGAYQTNIKWVEYHKYYYSVMLKSTNNVVSLSLGSGSGTSWVIVANNVSPQNFTKYETIITNGTVNTTNGRFYICDGNTEFTITNVQCFDLTQMFGSGNEPTSVAEFNVMFPNSYYPYTESQKMLVDKPTPTTYDDTDIGSQFLYSLYKPVRDYCNFANYFGLNGVYDWFLMNFFNGTAPLVFFIFFNLMIYWLIISILWLLFDVLIYIPLLIHRWLDKGSVS